MNRSGPDRDHQRRADRGADRVAAAHPVPEAERVRRVDPERLDLVESRRDGHEVLGDGRLLVLACESVEQPRLAQPGVGERLERAERLARDDEQRRRRVEALQRGRGIGRVDVRDEPALQALLPVRLEGLVGHHRPQVGPTDADVDDRADPLARDAGPGPRAHLLGEGVDPVQDLVHVGDHVLAVHLEGRLSGEPECRVQDGAVLGDVDVLATEHRVPALRDARLLGEREQRVDDLPVHQALGEVDGEVRGLEGQRRGAVGVLGEPGPQVGCERRREVAEPAPRVAHDEAWSI